MSQDLNMISYLCKRRPKDVADFILTDETLSYNLMSLLLSKDCSRYKDQQYVDIVPKFKQQNFCDNQIYNSLL